MAKKTEAAFEDWLRDVGLIPEKIVGAGRDIFRRIYARYVALRRTDFVRMLNGETRVADRRLQNRRGKITTGTTVEKWLESGCPVNTDGTISPMEVIAFLAAERKDAAKGRPSAASKAMRSAKARGGKGHETLSDHMRGLVETGDVVGLIGLLMECTDDLQTAEVVSKIVVNVINAEKGRVKAQADEYERKIRSGELLEARDVEQGRIARARYIRETLENMGTHASRLQHKTIVDARKELETIGREMLLALVGGEE